MADIYENVAMPNMPAQHHVDQGEQNVYQNVGKRRTPEKPKSMNKPKPAAKPKSSKAAEQKTYKYLVAIDIGQSTMGFAIAHAKNPREIPSLRNWAATKNFIAHKAPSVVFATSSETQTQVGFTGLETFANNYGSDYETEDQMGLAQRFTSVTKGANESVRIKIFHETITKLYQLAVSEVQNTYSVSVNQQDVKVIVATQPQKMRLKSKKMDVHKETLELLRRWNSVNKITDKVDAAFVYCRISATERKLPNKILVISAGGSNIELASYEASTDTTYTRMAHKSTWFGSNRINDYFSGFLRELFGTPFVDACKKENPIGWLELMNSFEMCKRGAVPTSKVASYTLPLDTVFGRYFETYHNGRNMKEYLQGNKDLSVTSDWKLRLSARVMKVFYGNVTTEIEQEISGMENFGSFDSELAFLVGGFADNEYMHQVVRKLFPDAKVVRPENPDVCALKGCIYAEEGSITIKK